MPLLSENSAVLSAENLKVKRSPLPLAATDFSEADQKRFWLKVDKNGPIVYTELGPCWEWTAYIHQNGYGQFRAFNRTMYSHRVSFFIEHGYFPTNETRHKCDNRKCVNQSHLQAGTHSDNMQDCASRGRLVTPRPPTTKLTFLEVQSLRDLRDSSAMTFKKLGALFNLSENGARYACRLTSWKKFQ